MRLLRFLFRRPGRQEIRAEWLALKELERQAEEARKQFLRDSAMYRSIALIYRGTKRPGLWSSTGPCGAAQDQMYASMLAHQEADARYRTALEMEELR